MLLAAMLPARAERVVIFQGDDLIHLAVIPLPLTQDGVLLSLYGTVRSNGLFMYSDHASSLSTQDGNIVHIVFEHIGSTSFTFSSGSFNRDHGNGYWSGSGSSVSFVPSSSLVVSRIIVTVDDSGSGSNESFTLCDLPNVEDGTIMTSDRELVVLWQARNNLYVKDRLTDCFGLIYGNVNQTYVQGDVIPAGWSAKKVTYGGEPELSYPEDFGPANDHVDVTPEEITAAEICHDYWAHYVVLKDVTISSDGTVLTDKDGNEIPWYNNTFNAVLPDNRNIPYDVYGIVGSYKPSSYPEPIYQLLPIQFGDGFIGDVCCFMDLFEMPNNTPVQFDCPLAVVYQGGNYLFLKDRCDEFGLMYGNVVGGPFLPGDLIIGAATWNSYQGAKQLIPYGEWRVVDHGPLVEPDEIGCIDEASADMCHWYVRFKNVTFVTEEGKTYIEDECGSMLIYNRFSIPIPEPGVTPVENPYDLNHDGEVNIADLNCLINLILTGKIEYDWTWMPQGDYEGTFDVTGFLTVYKNQLELYPVEIVPSDSTIVIVGDLNQDSEVNIADANALIDRILNQ